MTGGSPSRDRRTIWTPGPAISAGPDRSWELEARAARAAAPRIPLKIPAGMVPVSGAPSRTSAACVPEESGRVSLQASGRG